MIYYFRKQIYRGCFLLRSLIIYASKTGVTKRCAALLAANLGVENTDIFDIASGEPELSGYGRCIVGSYIRVGVIDKKISAFLKSRQEELFKMELGLFLCGCLEDKVSDAIVKNFSDDFLEHAVSVEFFGGELHPEKCKGAEKLFIRSVLKIAGKDPSFKTVDRILPESISAFAEEFSDK